MEILAKYKNKVRQKDELYAAIDIVTLFTKSTNPYMDILRFVRKYPEFPTEKMKFAGQGQQEIIVIQEKNLKQFIMLLLSGKRIDLKSKMDILGKNEISMTPFMKSFVEIEHMKIIQPIFEKYEPRPSFPIGKYTVDCYFKNVMSY